MNNSYLLPPNATAQEIALSGAIARISDVPVPNRDLYNPSLCPVALLPWLAWAFSLDDWDPSWSEAQKREAITGSIYVHRHKGTVGAVHEVLRASSASIGITEWFQDTPPSAPHTFRVDVEIEDRGIDQGTLDTIERQLTSVKPVRSHFTTRIIGRSTAMQCLGIAVFSGESTEILPYAITAIDAMPAIQGYAIAYQDITNTTIYPQAH
ncbi:MAG: phage tail protein I [Methylobacter sp.]